VRILILVLVILLVIILPIGYVFSRSATPVVSLATPVTVIGQATPISVHVSDRNGVRWLTAVVEQNGARYPVTLSFVQPSGEAESTWKFTAGVKTMPQLKDGKARLILEATSNDLLRRSGRWEGEVTVVTQPPSVTADSEQHYLYLGMADLATFTVSGSWTEAGVHVGDEKFRAWPMPDGKPGMFALYAFAWNNDAGNGAAGVRLEWCGQRRGEPAGDRVSEERAAALHNA